MKLFKVISPNIWATDDKEYEMKVFGGCPSLKRNRTPTRPVLGLNSGPHMPPSTQAENLATAPMSVVVVLYILPICLPTGISCK